ncbi:regulator [Nocardia sp. NPDC058058]|uniref:regulator n=1 Tax=unclassified Nocardia TaxID=2637762 RepID=UPI0035E26674
MSKRNNEFRDLAEAEDLAAAAAAGELIYGASVDADDVLPPPAKVPDSAEDTLVVTTVRLTVRQRRRAEEIARKRGTDLTALIRAWVDEGIAEDSDDYNVSAAEVKRLLAGLRRIA